MKLQAFAKAIMGHTSFLRHMRGMCDQLFDNFSSYKNQVPVFGFVLLNAQRTKLVLVRNWVGKSWSFPKGKVNQGEEPFRCAVREVHEETGFDAEPYARAEDFISVLENGKHITYVFQPVCSILSCCCTGYLLRKGYRKTLCLHHKREKRYQLQLGLALMLSPRILGW
jgi:mRNA-decapping enzyme subunit 2